MDTQDSGAPQVLVRTSVLVPEETDKALRDEAAKSDRPLSRVIRAALDEHVARQRKRKAAA